MEMQFGNRGTGYFGDGKIVRRVKQYLEDNKNIIEIDLEDMADALQRKYPEYQRRKKVAFQGLVRRAFDAVVKEYEQESQIDGSFNDVSDDDISSVASTDSIEEHVSNRANEQQTSLYGHKTRETGGEKELINISSDDEVSPSDSLNKDIRQALKNSAPNITIVPIKSQAIKNHSSSTIPNRNRFASNSKQSHLALKPSVVKNPTLLKVGETQKKKETDENSKKRKHDIDGDAVPGGYSQKSPKKIKPQQPKSNFVSRPSGTVFNSNRSTVTFKDFAGNKDILKELSKVILHVAQPEIYSTLGISPPRGLLLTGPPGCGKSLLAEAIVGELDVLMYKVPASELVSGVSGESEEHIRTLFNKAVLFSPCVVLLEEIDVITPNKATAMREMERRIVCQLASCLDELGSKEEGQRVLVIGTTSRPDAIDPSLRRAGRFDTEFSVGIPGVEARTEILRTVCHSLKLEPQFDFEKIAKLTPGYVGADLKSLATVAAMNAIFRYFENTRQALSSKMNKNQNKSQNSSDMEMSDDDSDVNKVNGGSVVSLSENRKEKSSEIVGSNPDEDLYAWLRKQPPSAKQLEGLSVTEQDFTVAMKKVCPSAKREGFATVPDVTWDDVGALHEIRQALQIAILAPVKYTKLYASVGISAPAGVLLCGPPGCGKTLLAKAVANEAGINFISVKGPELLNMYLGESERAVRQCFQRARNSAPCVIFFDELDALCPKRSESGEGGASMRIVNQMLTEMDGVEERGGVFLMAATNRPDILDPAVLRPGRLDKILYVGFPSVTDKVDILRTLTKNGTKPELSKDVSLEEISTWENCKGYTGADLAALVKEAAVIAIKEVLGQPAEKVVVSRNHFLKAVKTIRPSVTKKDRLYYEKLQKLYSASPVKELDDVSMEASVELSSSSSVTSQQKDLNQTMWQNSPVSSVSTEQQRERLQNVPLQVTEADLVLKDNSHSSSEPGQSCETAEVINSADKQSSDIDSTLDVDKSPDMSSSS